MALSPHLLTTNGHRYQKLSHKWFSLSTRGQSAICEKVNVEGVARVGEYISCGRF